MAKHDGKIPVTMLSGFLGAGKTTLLRYLLENSQVKIACVVNDVASINIDAKLVRNDKNRSKADGLGTTKDLADTVELQNGCACCNLQDELFASFEQILTMADQRGSPYARIVLENSGVAEPSKIRDKFKEAQEQGHPLLDRIYLDTLVTVVDCSTFGKEYASRQPLAARPDLGDGGNLRPVVDLLVEQIEVADFVILNKTDLLTADNVPSGVNGTVNGGDEVSLTPVDELVAIVSTLNPLSTVIPAKQGIIPLEVVFGAQAHAVVANLNIEGQHRGAVAAARSLEAAEHKHDHDHKHDHGNDHHHDHKHDHGHGHKHDDCAACESGDEHMHHDHHHHDHGHEGPAEDCAACKDDHDHKHDHGHGHDHKHDHDHHGHDHEHDHDHHGHDHKHEHSHERPATRAATRFGIKSFVYCRRRPFHPQRLKEMVLKWLPVASNKAIDNEAPQLGESPIKKVLRSKGFMWMSNSHTTAYYWSHAGQHFEIRDEGDWWCAVPEEDWPEAGTGRDVILNDWDLDGLYGDRRQEIVFIGVGMEQDKIEEQLDSALLTDEEMVKYNQRWAALPDPAHVAVDEFKKAQAAKKAAEHHHHHDHDHKHGHDHHDHDHKH